MLFIYRFTIPRRQAPGKDATQPSKVDEADSSSQGQMEQRGSHFGRMEMPAESVRAKNIVYERLELPINENSDALSGRAELM